jgi:hypothetical protein
MMCNHENQAGVDKAKAIWDAVEGKLFGATYLETNPILDSTNGW